MGGTLARIAAVLAAGAIFAFGGAARGVAAPIVLAAGAASAALLGQAEAADGAARIEDVRAGRVPFVTYARYARKGWPVSMWLRFSVATTQRHDRSSWLLVLPRTFESADLYRAGRPALHTGMYVPYAKRPSALYVPAFHIEDADLGGAPLLLHVVYYPDVPVAIHLVTEHAFFLWNEPYRVIEGLFLGTLIAVAFFNLFVFGVMRDRSALYYVTFIAFMIANEIIATGIGDEYFWPSAGSNARLAAYASSFLCFTAFLFFVRAFLRTKEEAPACDRTLLISYAVYAVVQIAQVTVPGGQTLVPLVLLVQMLAMLATIAVAVLRYRSGFQSARYFAAAFIPSTIGVLANLYYNAFIPGGNWFWASNGVEIGTMLQSIVLSFSVIDRLRLLQIESKRTRTELTAVSAHAKKMQTLALFDPLTGLANRIRFTDDLARALTRRSADGKRFAVLYCDLDGFKNINDLFGHRFGDEVLRVLAARLSSSLRAQDLIARLGGDEFAVLLEFINSPGQADHVANMLAHLLDEPIVLEGKIMPIGISVGRSVFPDDGQSIDELLHAADMRMYEMKQQRKAAAS
jgi:diguanylate cyclase (GGDEF)-like protein